MECWLHPKPPQVGIKPCAPSQHKAQGQVGEQDHQGGGNVRTSRAPPQSSPSPPFITEGEPAPPNFLLPSHHQALPLQTVLLLSSSPSRLCHPDHWVLQCRGSALGKQQGPVGNIYCLPHESSASASLPAINVRTVRPRRPKCHLYTPASSPATEISNPTLPLPLPLLKLPPGTESKGTKNGSWGAQLTHPA